MDLDAASLIGAALAVALAAVVQLAAGFGFGLSAVPLLSIAVGAHDAVVVALFLATFTNAFQAWTGRRDTDRPVAARLLAGAAVGLPFGFLVYQLVDDRVLRVVIGCSVIVAVVVIALGLDLRHAGPGLDAVGGALTGALTMSSGVNGPPLVFVLQARHFDQHRFRATVTTVFFVLDIVAVVTFAVDRRPRRRCAGRGGGVVARPRAGRDDRRRRASPPRPAPLPRPRAGVARGRRRCRRCQRGPGLSATVRVTAVRDQR